MEKGVYAADMAGRAVGLGWSFWAMANQECVIGFFYPGFDGLTYLHDSGSKSHDQGIRAESCHIWLEAMGGMLPVELR